MGRLLNKVQLKLKLIMFKFKFRKCNGLHWDGGTNCIKSILTMVPSSTAFIDGTAHMHEGTRLELLPNCYFEMGKRCTTNQNVKIVCRERIEIGNNVLIGPNVLIIDHDHDYHYLGIDRRDRYFSKPIKICDNVWIGANVVILKGVTIGEGAVIGAGSIISKDVQAGMICFPKIEYIERPIVFKEGGLNIE